LLEHAVRRNKHTGDVVGIDNNDGRDDGDDINDDSDDNIGDSDRRRSIPAADRCGAHPFRLWTDSCGSTPPGAGWSYH